MVAIIIFSLFALVVTFGCSLLYYKMAKKKEAVIFGITGIIVTLGCISFIWLDDYAALIFVVAAIFHIASNIILKRKELKIINLIEIIFTTLMILAFIFLTLATVYNMANGYNHIAYSEYEITIENGEINIKCDYQNIPDEIYEYITNKVELMNEADVTYIKDVVKFKYSCYTNIHDKIHDTKCTCKGIDICKECEEHIGSITIID